MRTRNVSLVPCCLFFFCAPVLLLLSGCAGAFYATGGAASPGASFTGIMHGGQQPVVGAKVYLYAAAVTGYGQPSVSLLTSSVPAVCGSGGNSACKDPNGNYYVLTGSGGNFSITGDWSCTSGTYIYLLGVGGNPGGYGENSSSELMALLGKCDNVNSSTFTWMNEVTTVASTYALAGFMSSDVQVSSGTSSASQAGLAAAFATASNLVNFSTGLPYTTTPAGNGAVPVQMINTIADFLAACENSSGGVAGDGSACGTLFSVTTPSAKYAPTTTVQASLNLAQNPAIDTSYQLFNLVSATPPWPNTLPYTPNDWTLPVVYTGGGLSYSYAIAVDGANNVWVVNYGYPVSGNGSVTVLNNLGAVQTGAGITNTSMHWPTSVAIDTSNNAWVPNAYSGSLLKISAASSSSPYAVTAHTPTGTSLGYPYGIAFDPSGNIWLSAYTQANVVKYNVTTNAFTAYTGGGLTKNGTAGTSWGVASDSTGNIFIASYAATSRVAKFNNSGVAQSSTGYTGGGMAYAYNLAVDQGNNLWVANFGASASTAPGTTISEISDTGTAVSTTAYSGGGLYSPFGIAVDGGNHIWVANAASYSLSEFGNNGTAISNGCGFYGTYSDATCALLTNETAPFNFPEAVAIDEAGNVWACNYAATGSVTELIGAATPTLTPMSAATAAGKPASKP